MAQKLAALTMAYNETVWAPVWARYYGRELGAEHCYMLDHGSDDGSTDGLEVNVERLARSALDEEARAALIGERVGALLERYDAVVHSDADELVVADPSRFAGLRDFAERVRDEVVMAAGLELQHLPGEEAALDPGRALVGQRWWVRFSGAMCKPAFVRRRVHWQPGFHACDAGGVPAGLCLVHLRYADLGLGLARLGRTRAQAFAHAGVNLHQRVSDAAFSTMVGNVAQLPRDEAALTTESGPLKGWIDSFVAAQATGVQETWLNMAGDRLWRLPPSWAGRF